MCNKTLSMLVVTVSKWTRHEAYLYGNNWWESHHIIWVLGRETTSHYVVKAHSYVLT